MNSQNFSLDFQHKTREAKLYIIVYDFESVGELEFIVDKTGCAHIHNVFVHEDYRGLPKLWKFFKKFDSLKAHTVLKESIAYWQRLGADIVSEAGGNKFEDIVFDLEELVSNE